MAGEKLFYGFLQRRELVVPSLRGLLILFLAIALFFFAFLLTIFPFLAVNHPVKGDVLVVEGWIPDYALRQALRTFREHGYRKIVTTGGPLPQGMPYSSYGTHAEFAAVSLKLLGLGADSVVSVPSIRVDKDRTYMEGVALKDWLSKTAPDIHALDLFSFSAHARRSFLLYHMALGSAIKVGIYASPDADFEPKRWWKSSAGVRMIVDETVAYAYARLLFHP